ncbi:MAG: hypothetical protein D6698_08515 [Gammaproteobacteria bacterium]|nr:MAG: hypothetical protein D6698_08515 [Gammaproteobacteria bacterium]
MRLMAFLLLLLPFSVQAADLRIGVKEDIPYFGYYNAKGERAGIEVDFGKELAKFLGRSPKFISVSSSQRIPFLQANKLDVVIATFSITPDRSKEVAFSEPYFETGQSVMVLADSPIQSIQDLSSKKVGVVKGATSGPQLLKAQPQARLVEYKTYYEAYLELLFGQVDAISTDEVVLRGLKAIGEGAAVKLEQRKGRRPVFLLDLNRYTPGNRLRIIRPSLSHEKYGIAVRKGSPLLDKINAWLASPSGRHTLRDIIQRHLGGES